MGTDAGSCVLMRSYGGKEVDRMSRSGGDSSGCLVASCCLFTAATLFCILSMFAAVLFS